MKTLCKHKITSCFAFLRKKQKSTAAEPQRTDEPIDYKKRLDKILNTFYGRKRGMWATFQFPLRFENKLFHSVIVPGKNEEESNQVIYYHFKKFKYSKDKPRKITYYYYTYTKEEGVKNFEINEENAELYQKVYEMFIAQDRVQRLLEEFKNFE
ncbi:MAG TPA: hypothetical protein VK050_05535 [Flavobacteriaceae bacterium]|nr:hypothetical protein [Flavobacteriaceae bacterium]